MKRILLAILIIGRAIFCNAQTSSNSNSDPAKVYTFVEQNPEFPGGDAELIHFLSQNITYPQMERDNDIQGKVLLRFVVMEDGSVDSVMVVRSVSPGLDKEAVRVVKLLPKFKPGKQQGKPVKVYFNLPIVFRLTDDDKSTKAMKEKADKDPDFRTGLLLVKSSNWTQALKSFSASVKKFPKDYLGFQFKGSCEFSLHKLKDACKDFEKAKALGSPDADEFLRRNCN